MHLLETIRCPIINYEVTNIGASFSQVSVRMMRSSALFSSSQWMCVFRKIKYVSLTKSDFLLIIIIIKFNLSFLWILLHAYFSSLLFISLLLWNKKCCGALRTSLDSYPFYLKVWLCSWINKSWYDSTKKLSDYICKNDTYSGWEIHNFRRC